MSYCRFGADSDVYLIKHGGGGWACYCGIKSRLDSEEDALAHLENHARRGDKVPSYAMDRLREEIAERPAITYERPERTAPQHDPK